MNKDYEIVIGLEIHVQAKTRSKMFCRCAANYFSERPNTHVCPVCLGLPGALPVPNKVAIRKSLKLGLALNCEINKFSKFDRKNYFYPDLPKGYQITQFDIPFCVNGYLEFDLDGDSKRIRITRVHQEEDTGKSIHQGTETLLDFNKSGIPLIEIVTEPDFTDTKEITAFAKRLKQIVKYLEISDADMEKGQMRFELNMSLRPSGTKALPEYKVEVKNIGSISVLEKVITCEFTRQSAILNKGKLPLQETRGIKDMTGRTYSQRVKENSDDYRYFPEPDIPPIITSADELQRIKAEIIELPQAKKDRYQKDFGLEPSTAETIIATKAKADWFEKAVEGCNDEKIFQNIARWMIGDLFALMKAAKIKLKDLKLSPGNFRNLIEMLSSSDISGTIAKQILGEIFRTNEDPVIFAKEHNLTVIHDEASIKVFAKTAISANPKVVADINKNPNALKFLVGQVMRASKGKADPKTTEKILRNLLKI